MEMARNDEQGSPVCLAIWWCIIYFMLWGGYYLWYVLSYQKFKASAIKISCPLSSKTASRHLVHNYCTYQYAWKFLSVPAAAKWMNQKYSLFNLISSLCWMMWINLYYVIALTLALASERALAIVNKWSQLHRRNAFKMVSIEFSCIEKNPTVLKFPIDAPEWCHWSQMSSFNPN